MYAFFCSLFFIDGVVIRDQIYHSVTHTLGIPFYAFAGNMSFLTRRDDTP